MPQPSVVPVVIAVPHAGRRYSDSLRGRMRDADFAALKLEDRYVDRIAQDVAAATGAGLLVADAPRAMIDLNRDSTDIDWEMIEAGTDSRRARSPGRRARTGLGLIPRRLPGLGEIWNRRFAESELVERIAAIHAPYHAALADMLRMVRDRWGAALLIDLHSMPPLAGRGNVPGAEFVIGDRYGTSCSGALVASAFAHFGENRRVAAHNRPYAGGYVLERQAAPARSIHAMQIEIDRTCYLDAQLREPGAGFADTAGLLTGLVSRLASEVALIGSAATGPGARSDWSDAAE